MTTYFSEKEMVYDGQQLRSLFAYMKFGVLGDSVVSWVGECNIPFEHMVDGEDVRANSEIRGARMVHFIIEKFDTGLFAGVALQRIMASLTIDTLRDMSPQCDLTEKLIRDGDDVYVSDVKRELRVGSLHCDETSRPRKFSISIATQSPTSTLVHFAVNVVNDGTPVPTVALQDFQVDAVAFSKALLKCFAREVTSMVEATQKVRSVN